jgi:protein TonB
MFDLITGAAKHTPRHQSLPILVSTAAHVVVLGVVIAGSVLFVTNQIPEIPSMMAFVAAPAAPPPPPPPVAAAVKKTVTPQAARPTPGQFAAPIEAPPSIEPEPFDGEDDEGVPGGVEGGIPGGAVGGVVGGLPDLIPPPPPPARRGPVRVGGQIQTPALTHRVEPYYPPLAVQAHIEGMVILEAIIDEQGAVSEVKVLRMAHPLLDREAILAVRQWRYSPLLLNGIRVPFMLTVTLSFRLEEAKE